MARHTAHGDGVHAAGGDGAKAEIHVLAAVDVAFVESAELQPQRAVNEHTGPGDGAHRPDRLQPAREERGRRAEMLHLAFDVEEHAGVIHGAGVDAALDVAHEARARPERAVGSEHGLKPAGGENEIVVEQGEELAAGEGNAAVVGGGVAEVAFVEHDLERRGQRGEPGAGAIRAAVVHDDDLVRRGRRAARPAGLRPSPASGVGSCTAG